MALALLVMPPGEGRAGDEPAVGVAEDFMVVDCLLPGRVRRLGGHTTFLTPRRPVRTTALDCRIRGGEYTELDRASYSTALKVWLAQAQAGDAEAQVYVAQIHEKGLGVEPDFATAARWYRAAAEQGNSAAALALGTLYEQGKGVAADPAEALRWFRRAAKLPDDVILTTESEQQSLAAEQQALIGERDSLRSQIETERQRVADLERELTAERQHQSGAAAARARLEKQLEAARQQLATLQATSPGPAPSPAATATAVAAPPPAVAAELARLDYGPYVALVIGNANYGGGLSKLPAARSDAEAVAQVLETRYGFKVIRLFDADRYQTLSALNQLREELTERHNLLLYYAGHSASDPATGRSWWQPVDADPTSRVRWVSTAVITDQLDLIPAQRVLLISDAAFAGSVTRSGLVRLPSGMTPQRRLEVVRRMLDQRVRMLLASGTDQPMPQGGATNSVFAQHLVAALGEENQVTLATDLYRDLERRAEGNGGAVPSLSLLRWARSEAGGDFFFVPRRGH